MDLQIGTKLAAQYLMQSTIYFFAGSQGVNLGAQIFTRSTTWKTLNRKVFCPIYLIKFREA